MNLENVSKLDIELLRRKYPNNFEEILEKIKNDYPVQYLIGDVEFINTKILVNESVLIPRFETEGLVDLVIKYIKNKFNRRVSIIDLGTGSGCIAIALKKNVDCDVWAVDISSDALEVARKNALLNDTEIIFLNQDMLIPLKNSYDVIVANPPYIDVNGYVCESTKKYEPDLALYADDKGLYYYKEILKIHLGCLNKPGLIAFEIGDNQKNKLIDILKNYPKLKYEFFNDLQGLPRYLLIYNE